MYSLGGKDQHGFEPEQKAQREVVSTGGNLGRHVINRGEHAWVRIEDGLGVASAAVTDMHLGGGSAVMGSLRGLPRLGSSSKMLWREGQNTDPMLMKWFQLDYY
jgi:hypothetical protein